MINPIRPPLASTVRALPELQADAPDVTPHVRLEALLGPQGEVAPVAAHYAQTRPLIESMLDPTTRPEERRAICRDLGVVPASMLRMAQQRGMQIYVVRPGETQLPARLFGAGQNLQQIGQDWTDFASQRERYNAAQTQVSQAVSNDPIYQERMRAMPPPLVLPGSTFHAALAAQAKARQRIGEEAVERLGLHLPDPPQTPPGATLQAVDQGTSLEDVARQHGASTPEQTAAFAALMRKQNPQWSGVQPAGESLAVPDVWFYQDRAFDRATWNSIANLNQSTAKGIHGAYNPLTNVLVVKQEMIPDPSPVLGHHRAVLHEFAHCVQAMINDDPQHAADFTSKAAAIHSESVRKTRGLAPMLDAEIARRFPQGASNEQVQAVAMELAEQHSPLPTAYSAREPEEEHADAFEAYYTADRNDGIKTPGGDGEHDRLKRNAPEMYALITDQIAQFERGDIHPVPPAPP